MERTLVRDLCEQPHAFAPSTQHQLRYALGFARLTAFQPGAARKGGRTNRPEVEVAEEPVLAFRGLTFKRLGVLLRPDRGTPGRRLREARRALPALLDPLRQYRSQLLRHHGGDFSAQDLDDEVGRKTLVSVAGGGGGAGYVYIGAYQALEDAAIRPGYIIGASIGSVIGLFRARKRVPDLAADVELAKSLSWDEVFRVVSTRTRFGLPGLLRLFLHAAIQRRFSAEDGRWFRLPDLEVPYEAIVAGVWKDALRETPDEYARHHRLILRDRPSRARLGRLVAEQLVRMVAFFNPMLVKEIVVGGDELTRTFDAVDAAGFSAAVPGILHYDIARDDPHMEEICHELFRREEISCLIDGGVANNVPARTAWHQVQAGKVGTRNCYYLGFDCFHPRWNPSQVWLQPITRLVQLQVAANRPYAHRIVRFKPTLSPANLLPRAAKIDRAVGWGREQMEDHLPLIKKFLEPVEWVG